MFISKGGLGTCNIYEDKRIPKSDYNPRLKKIKSVTIAPTNAFITFDKRDKK